MRRSEHPGFERGIQPLVPPGREDRHDVWGGRVVGVTGVHDRVGRVAIRRSVELHVAAGDRVALRLELMREASGGALNRSRHFVLRHDAAGVSDRLGPVRLGRGCRQCQWDDDEKGERTADESRHRFTSRGDQAGRSISKGRCHGGVGSIAGESVRHSPRGLASADLFPVWRGLAASPGRLATESCSEAGRVPHDSESPGRQDADSGCMLVSTPMTTRR